MRDQFHLLELSGVTIKTVHSLHTYKQSRNNWTPVQNGYREGGGGLPRIPPPSPDRARTRQFVR